MNEYELINQIISLLDYIIDNNETISDKDFESSIRTIYDILNSFFKVASNEEELNFLGSMIDNGDINFINFYRKCQTALIKSLFSQKEALIKARQVDDAKINYLINQVKDNKSKHDFSDRYIELDNIVKAFNKRYQEKSEHFKGKGVIYSTITGNYDSIKEPLFDGELEYILLTDRPHEGYKGKWQIKVVDNPKDLPPDRFARYLKMHPFELFPDYDWSVYLDGKQLVTGDFNEFVSLFGKNSGMICFPHFDTNTLEEQANAISIFGKANLEELKKQIKHYKDLGYKEKGYLIETACLVRDHHDEALKKVMDDWWKELNSFNHNRDQMSFDYACWKNGYEYDLCNQIVYANPWCIGTVTH
ncbi:MAG: DUF616 domain-containing protein [Lachnospiraceae bacterium]|nr:DUF616 domain-containing protein [Lachnospiraceae bacterium]